MTRGADWVRDHRAELASAVSIVTGAASGWAFGHAFWFWSVAPIFAGATVLWVVFSVNDRRALSSLTEQLEEADVEAGTSREAVRGLLAGLGRSFMEEAQIWDSSTCRLSIYGHVDNQFFLISRVSANPKLESKGRFTYPDDEGHISVIWEKGSLLEKGWRESTSRKRAIEQGIPETVVEKLTMLPRGLSGKRIEGHDGSPVGVVLLESTDPHALDDTLDYMDASRVFSALEETVVRLEDSFEPLGSE